MIPLKFFTFEDEIRCRAFFFNKPQKRHVLVGQIVMTLFKVQDQQIIIFPHLFRQIRIFFLADDEDDFDLKPKFCPEIWIEPSVANGVSKVGRFWH